MEIPVWKGGGRQKNSHLGTPQNHKVFVTIRGLTYNNQQPNDGKNQHKITQHCQKNLKNKFILAFIIIIVFNAIVYEKWCESCGNHWLGHTPFLWPWMNECTKIEYINIHILGTSYCTPKILGYEANFCHLLHITTPTRTVALAAAITAAVSIFLRGYLLVVT